MVLGERRKRAVYSLIREYIISEGEPGRFHLCKRLIGRLYVWSSLPRIGGHVNMRAILGRGASLMY